jgi:hypothetical protein
VNDAGHGFQAFLTTKGQSAQYMFCTANVIVLSPARAADAVSSVSPNAIHLSILRMVCSPFTSPRAAGQ